MFCSADSIFAIKRKKPIYVFDPLIRPPGKRRRRKKGCEERKKKGKQTSDAIRGILEQPNRPTSLIHTTQQLALVRPTERRPKWRSSHFPGLNVRQMRQSIRWQQAAGGRKREKERKQRKRKERKVILTLLLPFPTLFFSLFLSLRPRDEIQNIKAAKRRTWANKRGTFPEVRAAVYKLQMVRMYGNNQGKTFRLGLNKWPHFRFFDTFKYPFVYFGQQSKT